MNDQDDYFLAGKSIRFFPLMMTFIATQVGGGTVLGATEEAYRYGWAVLCYPLGTAIGLMLLGFGVGRRLAQFKVSTVAQILEVVYGSAALKKIASLLSVVSLFMILVGQMIASSKFMISAGVENPLWFCAFWAIVIVYTVMGGLKAVVATDVVQALFFIIALLIGFGTVFYCSDLPMREVLNSSASTTFVSATSKLCGWLILPMLFMIMGQDMGQRCFAGESPGVVSKASLCAGIGLFSVCAIPVFLGVFARSSGIEVPPGASVLMTVIAQKTTPFIAAMIGCAILAAIISTADSLINAISSNLAQDFEIPFLRRDDLRGSQILAAGISVAALAGSFYLDNVVDVLIQSYELSVSCLSVPITMAIFSRKGQPWSAPLAIAFGAGAFLSLHFIATPIPKEILSIAASSLGFFLPMIIGNPVDVWHGNMDEKADRIASR